MLLIAKPEYAEAVTALQSALRSDPSDASAWEALGASYQPQGRLTAALKAYGRALELEPSRVYSLIQSGNLHLALGTPSKALECHEKALDIDPAHPAALLGAAEALSISAGGNIHVGALTAAAIELDKATAYALQCARSHSTLVSAWKQLGDVLLLHRCAPPPDEVQGVHDEKRDVEQTPIDGKLAAWRRRLESVRGSRRAYAKALHLSPNTAPAWQDAAATFYHEAQLQRDLPTEQRHPIQAINTCSATCERLLRGALRLDPEASGLWLALGVSASDPTIKEYALSRALQLDPRSSGAWVALARLYIAAGEGHLAELCLQHGRSQDPTVAAIWEAMAALAALTPAGQNDSAEYNEHALGLGAGHEGLLGFAEAALTSGRGCEGAVYVAARKAKEMMPLDPGAANAWGLACEAKGDPLSAVKAYRDAEALLSMHGSVNGGTSGVAQHPETSNRGVSLPTAVRLNLARALASAGLAHEAVAAYEELTSRGCLQNQPHAWLSYAVALAEAGDVLRAEEVAHAVLHGASTADADVATGAVKVLMQLKCCSGQPEAAVGVLQESLPRLQTLAAGADDIEQLWLTAVAAVAVAEPGSAVDLVQKAASAAKSWALGADNDATFLGQLAGLQAAAMLAASGDAGSAAVHYANAVHTSPWAADLRIAFSGTALDASQSTGASALSLLAATPGGFAPEAPELVDAALHAAAAATVSSCIARHRARCQDLLKKAAAAVHVDPTQPQRWYCAALLATQLASTPADFKKGLSWCHGALAMHSAHSVQNGDRKVRLLVCSSECLLRSQTGDAQSALSFALAAIEAAGSDAMAAEALRQAARCHWFAGDLAAAEEHYRRAMICAGPGGTALAAYELALMLERSGRGATAADILNTEAARLSSFGTGEELLGFGKGKTRAGLGQWMLLRRALLLARIGDLDAALAAADDSQLRGTQGPERALRLLAKGALTLQQALHTAGDEEERVSLLGEARRALSEGVQLGQDGVVARALLAHVEHAGTMRKKCERVAAHAEEALKQAPRPVEGELLSLLGGLLESRALHAKAVHAAPWEQDWWGKLLTVA